MGRIVRGSRRGGYQGPSWAQGQSSGSGRGISPHYHRQMVVRRPRHSNNNHHDRYQSPSNNSYGHPDRDQNNSYGDQMGDSNQGYNNTFPNHQQQHHHHQQQQQHHNPRPEHNNHFGPSINTNSKAFKDDYVAPSSSSYQTQQIDTLKQTINELSAKMEKLETRLHELESVGSQQHHQNHQQQQQPSSLNNDADHNDKDKARKLKLREKRAAKNAAKRAAVHGERASTNAGPSAATSTQEAETAPTATKKILKERYADRRRAKRDLPPKSAQLINDDSTTQAAEPSSEDRPDGNAEGPPRVRVFRRKKQFQRRRADSSERNSNDTSPQNELNTNGNEDPHDANHQHHTHERQVKQRKKTSLSSRKPKTYPELTEAKLEEIVQALKREFLNTEKSIKTIKGTMNEKGPKVVYEFVLQIFDYTICDVTSPSKLSEIANNLYQLIISEDNMTQVDFQKGFYEAITAISKREDELVIDSPRFMDILGQIFANCIIPMADKHKNVVRKFLNKCIESYNEKNRASLLASIMKGIESEKSDRFAKEIWDLAQLNWANILPEGIDLGEFLESHGVSFTTKTFPPEPRKSKKNSKDLEKFSDDVTNLVETRCSPSDLEDLIKDLSDEDKTDYLGYFVYAIIRGCLDSDGGDYRLNQEAISKYSSILQAKHANQDDVAVKALTELTKLWHQYDCPQDLMKMMLMQLYSLGTASLDSLDRWLNSDQLKGVPGIGAARLGTKRYIEELKSTIAA